jgi:dipeptide/tripeptide permease
VTGTLRQIRSFPRPIQVLLINQVGINIGFYMLMPYLATYLTGHLGLAAWAAGLILGLRNLSQQGMFLIGGTLADRLGYKPLIMAGCALRIVGFGLFAVSGAPAILVIAAVLTGLAGALFNPAARAYVAHEAGDRKVEAFALFNIFYQAGILIGPLIGIVLLGVAFPIVCLAAAGVFAMLTGLQWRYLPPRRGAEAGSDRPVLTDWREALNNRPFIAFAVAMFASYSLSFQIYLGLPLEVKRITGGQAGVVMIYAISAVLALAGQVRLTNWCRSRWSPGQAIAGGLALMSMAFLPLALEPDGGPGLLRLAPVLVSAALLAIGTMMVFPFEMAMITSLAGDRLIGTYYGLYNLLSGVGILLGNLASGGSLDIARAAGLPALPWLVLFAAGAASVIAVRMLDRRGDLTVPERVSVPERECR